MNIIRSIVIILFVTGFTFSLFAQIPGIPSNTNRIPIEREIAEKQDEQEKTKKLSEQKKEVIEQILVDAEKLEFPEYSATAFSKAGGILCEFDKNRAKKIFERSLNELILAQNKIELTKNNDLKKFNFVSSRRLTVFQSISDCNLELAYDYLYKSRTEKFQKSLDEYIIKTRF